MLAPLRMAPNRTGASPHEPALRPTGISSDKLEHFAVHGWVCLPSALSENLLARLLAATDGLLSRLTPWDRHVLNGCPEPHLLDPAFLDLFLVPGLVPAVAQLLGSPAPRLRHSILLESAPQPALVDGLGDLKCPERWDWHRDFSPHSIVRRDPSNPGRLTSQVVVAAAYLTPTSPSRGATAFLDGSHLHDGGLGDMPDELTMVHLDAPAGSIALFSEALFHAAPPVVGPDRRVALLSWMTAPWFAGDEVAPPELHRHEDETLRSIFRPPHFGDNA